MIDADGLGNPAEKVRKYNLMTDNKTYPVVHFRMADYATSEIALAKIVLPSLSKGMLCLAEPDWFHTPTTLSSAHRLVFIGCLRLRHVTKGEFLPESILSLLGGS